MLDNLDLFDLARGRRARDEGMAKVQDETLTEYADRMLEAFVGYRWTGEDVRAYIEGMGYSPGHPNAWGAVINALVRRGRLEKTGEYRQMRRVSSHARVNPVYFITQARRTIIRWVAT